MITSHPDDEMAEIWDGIVTQLAVGSAIAVVLFLITFMVVSRALAPIADAVGGDDRESNPATMTRGSKPDGPPELAAICNKLNHLAGTLGEAVDEKRRLAERVVSLQDVERKEIARELHDEFGPYLFALRAHASALTRMAEAASRTLAVCGSTAARSWNRSMRLQQFNRRVLEKLRPPGLSELGLREALGALLRLWGDSHPDVVIETAISPELGETRRDRRSHHLPHHPGGADQCVPPRRRHLRRRLDRTGRASGRDGTSRGGALVRVRDNGGGLRPDHRLGLGLTGMHERILALGGTLTVASGEGGVTVEALVPNAPACANVPSGIIPDGVRDLLMLATARRTLHSSRLTGGDAYAAGDGMGRGNGRAFPDDRDPSICLISGSSGAQAEDAHGHHRCLAHHRSVGAADHRQTRPGPKCSRRSRKMCDGSSSIRPRRR